MIFLINNLSTIIESVRLNEVRSLIIISEFIHRRSFERSHQIHNNE
ncbi:MAG: hypothetical protein V7K39_17670 [Nostoc sp.]